MIHAVCKDIMINLRINKFIETGTFIGETTVTVSRWFQELHPDFGVICGETLDERLNSLFNKRVIHYPIFKNVNNDSIAKIYSVDIDKERQSILTELFSSNQNINVIKKSSEKFLEEAIKNGLVTDKDSCFFYLDAHWGQHWPLREEIREILKLPKSVIAIDDFVVPWRPWHGFDFYRTKICGWYYIRSVFKKRRDIHIFYPKKSNMDNRGSVIIFLGYCKNELRFMRQIACFESFLFKGAPLITLIAKLGILFLIITGRYTPLINYYLSKKWGSSAQSSRMKNS